MIRVSFQFDPHISKLDTTSVKKVIAVLSQDLKVAGNIGVRITDEQTVLELNRQYSGEDKTTDVLSFPYGNGEELGDIVISRSHISVQAERAGTNEVTEFALLTLHGILHILGYDHHLEAERATMDALQSKYLGLSGLPYRNFDWQDVVR